MAILSEKIEKNLISITIESSNLSDAVYDTEAKVLTVTFKKGGKYQYEGVPWDVFTKLRMSPSQGSFFSKEISKTYKFTKL